MLSEIDTQLVKNFRPLNHPLQNVFIGEELHYEVSIYPIYMANDEKGKPSYFGTKWLYKIYDKFQHIWKLFYAGEKLYYPNGVAVAQGIYS